MKKSGDRGFTLLETIMALAITSMIALFAVGFIRPQMKLYEDFDVLSHAKAICSRAYVDLEEILRYGYVYYVDPHCPEKLSYYVRQLETGDSMEVYGEAMDGLLPPADTWPCVSAEDLDVGGLGELSLKLDFTKTSPREARALIVVMKEEKPVYEQEVVIRSMYGDQGEGDGYYGG